MTGAVVIISGVQGTGKTTLARAVSERLRAVQSMLLDHAVTSGGSVVIESVMAEQFREDLKAEARSSGLRVVVVECICSDSTIHRRRVDDRRMRDPTAMPWSRVETTMRAYVQDSSPDYVADAVGPVDEHVLAIERLVGPLPP